MFLYFQLGQTPENHEVGMEPSRHQGIYCIYV